MTPRSNPRHERERVYDRGHDAAEAANRPLESKTLPAELADAESRRHDDEPPDPHHRLNTPVGEPYPDADSDPYRPSSEDDEADRASGTRGPHQGVEERG